MELNHPITRQFGVLVRGVAKKELSTGINKIAAKLPFVGNRIVGIHFQPVLRNTRKLVARRYLNVAGGIGEGIIGRAQRERALKGGVDETVIDARLPLVIAIADACFDSLTTRIADVLEEAGADNRARDAENLAGRIRAEEAEIPIDRACRLAPTDAECAAQPGLIGRRHDLLQTGRVGSEKKIEAARPCRVGTGDFAWCRRAVRLREIEIAGHIPRDLIGGADRRIKPAEARAAAERGAYL